MLGECDLLKIEHLAVGDKVYREDVLVAAPTGVRVAALVALNGRWMVNPASAEEAKRVDKVKR